MRITLFSLTCIVFLTSQSAFGQITLEKCQAMAEENYPLIQQYDLIEKSNEFNLHNANKAYLPQLDVTLIGGVIEGLPSFSLPGAETESSNLKMISLISLNQTIWDGGITKAKKEIIQATTEISNADVQVSLYAIQERVNNLYFGILLIDENLKQLEIFKSTLERNYKRVEAAIENGIAFNSDLDEIMVEVINADQKVTDLNYNKAAYLNMLSVMIGEQIDETQTLIRPEVQEMFIAASINRPELKVFQNQENLITSKSKIDKAMIYPKIGVLATGVFIQPGVDFGLEKIKNVMVAGVSVNWSLGGLYKNNNNKKLTELDLQKVNVNRETFLFNTNLELTQTEMELEKYQVLVDQDKELVEIKNRIKSAYDVKYENGICTMSELLDKVNDESLANQTLITHEIQYLMKAYSYKNKSGN